jgi:hypothetical protein
MISTIKTTVIAAGISFAVGAVSAWWITADYKNAKHESIVAKMKLDAADAVAKAQQKAIEVERENNRLAQEIEVQNAKFKQELDKIGRDNERLVNEFGLYDRHATPSDCPVPTDAKPTTKPATPPTGSKLSRELSEFLLSETRRADQAAAYAKTCFEWVKQLQQLEAKR